MATGGAGGRVDDPARSSPISGQAGRPDVLTAAAKWCEVHAGTLEFMPQPGQYFPLPGTIIPNCPWPVGPMCPAPSLQGGGWLPQSDGHAGIWPRPAMCSGPLTANAELRMKSSACPSVCTGKAHSRLGQRGGGALTTLLTHAPGSRIQVAEIHSKSQQQNRDDDDDDH